MFKVICITKPDSFTNTGVVAPIIIVGNTYEVTEVEELGGHTWYALAGIDPQFVYDAILFAKISGISMGEIEEEYQEQEAASLDREFAKIVHEYENDDHA